MGVKKKQKLEIFGGNIDIISIFVTNGSVMNKRAVSDEEILQMLHTDKMTGVRLLFERYYVPLVLWGEQFLHDRAKAEDVVQDFFVRLWEDNYLLKISAPALSSYLFTAVRNACLTLQNKKDTLRRANSLAEVEIPVEAFSETTDERTNRVLEEVKKLPERTRLVVEEIMLKGKKYKEVALDLGISVNTVKYLLREGTRKLRENLKDGFKTILLYLFGKKV